jgi:hypothetical protein
VQLLFLNPNQLLLPMIPGCQKMTMAELVDILAQKTQMFTQLMVYKNFGNEYKECKEIIRQILAEIELRKASTITGQNQQTTI